MDKQIIRVLAVGIPLYVVLIALAYVQKDLTVPQLILIFVTPFMIGFLSGGIKKGAILGFLISLLMVTLEVSLMAGGSLNPNVLAAVFVMMSLPIAALSCGLGAAGGLVGKRVFKKQKQNPPT